MAKNKTKKIIVAGSLVIESIYPRVTRNDRPKVRAAKRKASTEAQKRMNRIYSYQKLELMLAANFRPGDLVITLTYDDQHLPQTRKAAEARLKYFRSLLSKQRRSDHQDMVMIWSTECKHGDGRYHHHIVVNATGEDYEQIRKLWIYGGNVEINPLVVRKDKNYQNLAEYMCKEEPEYVGQRSWSYTRNCRKPEIETFRVEDDTQVQAPSGAMVLGQYTEENPYCYYKIVKYIAPGWNRSRVKAKRRKRRN